MYGHEDVRCISRAGDDTTMLIHLLQCPFEIEVNPPAALSEVIRAWGKFPIGVIADITATSCVFSTAVHCTQAVISSSVANSSATFTGPLNNLEVLWNTDSGMFLVFLVPMESTFMFLSVPSHMLDGEEPRENTSCCIRQKIVVFG
jgi:hypothetical protein